MMKLALAFACMSSLGACATITRGTTDALIVNANPANAMVRLSTGETCNQAPCAFKLPRKSELNVNVTHPRCREANVRVTNRVSSNGGAGMAGNVLFGGIIGVGVDATSGAMLDLTPNPVNVALACD